MATKMQDTVGKEGTNDICTAISPPKETKANGELLALIEIAKIQDDIRDKSAFDDAQQRSSKEECRPASEARLTAGYDAPRHHLNGYPVVGSKLLADQLRRELGGQKGDVEYRLSGIVVVGVHAQVFQESV